MSIIKIDWSRITLTDSEGEMLLYGNISYGETTTYRRAVREWSYATYLCSGATTIELVCSLSKITRLYADREIKFGDTSANQILRIYLYDKDASEGSEYLAYEGKVLGTSQDRNTITLTASSEALAISQNKKEFTYQTDAEGYISASELMEHLVRNAGIKEDTGEGVELQTDKLIANDARFYATEYFPNETIWQAHGQLASELIDHLVQMSAGYTDSSGSYSPPIVYFPSENNKDTVFLRSFGCGLSASVSPIEISQLNGAIVGDISIAYANREDVVNRVYFYRARPATYDDQGEIIDPGDPNELTECYYEPDTVNRYGSRSVYLSYPEFIDKHDGGTAALQMMGKGICRFQNDPQDVVSVICDYSALRSIGDCILNNTYIINDTRGKKAMGEYICIGYVVKGTSLQVTLELAQKSPFKADNLADNLSVTEQRLSAVEAKTANLDNTLVMKIGTAALSAVEVDCNKHWANRSFSGINNIKCGTITPNADATYNLGSSSLRWGTLYVASIRAESAQISGNVSVTGTLSQGGVTVATQTWVQNNTINMSDLNNISVNVEPISNGRYNLGSASYKWNNLYANYVNASSVYVSSGGGLTAVKTWANTNDTEWPCKVAINDFVINLVTDLGKDDAIISRTGSGTINNDSKSFSGCIRIGLADGTKTAQICYGRSDQETGFSKMNMYYESSFIYPPIVIALNQRTTDTAMGDFRSAYSFSTSMFTMYTDTSRVAYIAVGY